MSNKILKELQRGKLNNMSVDEKKKHSNQIISQVLKDLESGKERMLFFCPDLNVVNPLVKLIYDIVKVLNEENINAYVLHEHDGFKVDWLKGYGKVKVDYLHKKVSSKGKRLKKEYEFKLSDSLFVTDVYLEVLQDLPKVAEMNLIQKTVIVTGYAGLYTMNPGQTFSNMGINNLIFFETQVMYDYEKVYKGFRSYLVSDIYSNENNLEKKDVQEPYILVSGAGNLEYINEFANIFHNKYPLFDFIKIKVVNRASLEAFTQDVNDAILFLDMDRKYVTNFNSNLAMQLKTPYMTINGIRERSKNYSNNLLNGETDMFSIVESVVEYIYSWVNNSSNELYEHIYKTKFESNNKLFKKCFTDIVSSLKEQKKEYFSKISNINA